ncbi:hypothetical protein DPMN_188462 [Dreissena polymorpha]|uniref:Uncharacterized protein n=1 Tax=Dreissena polymorpha TaxID=45954 RepID=A0A9D4DQ44_DREPO|nr:hypothetical protein DPMN_188462 [Dreissena polymorpha]
MLAPGDHIFRQFITISKLSRAIMRTNVLIKLTTYKLDHICDFWRVNKSLLQPFKEKRLAPWPPCFKQAGNIFELIQGIITKILDYKYDLYSVNKENAQSPGGHVFQPTGTILELIQDIIWTNLLTKFHEDWAINVAF